MNNLLFQNNNANFQGGAIYFHSLITSLTFSNSQMYSNSADYQGGALFADQLCSNITVANVVVSSNTVSNGDGGGFCFNTKHSYIVITNSTFVSNSVFQNGGALSFMLAMTM